MPNILNTSSSENDTIDRQLAAARPRLLRLAQSQGVLHDAADDVVQETLLEAWRHLNSLRKPEHFDAWLNGICRNMCLRWLRTQSIATTHQVTFSQLHLEENHEDQPEIALPDPALFDPVEELNRQDMTVLLDRALGHLPKTTREAVELHYLAELPQREAALQLGMTIHALEERLYRARRQLRQLLNNELRSEAEMFGLSLEQEASEGWRMTREWCFYCGNRRFIGKLESSEDGFGNLRMRCPSCSSIHGDFNVNTHLPELYGLHTFKPALKRASVAMKPYMLQALRDGGYPCRACGVWAKLRLVPPYEPYGDRQRPHPEHVMTLECPACGEYSSMWAFGVPLWNHPVPRAFKEQHLQCIIGPEAVIEYDNQTAIRCCLIDFASKKRLIVIVNYHTLQVLTTFQE